jgi:serine protease Do
VILSDTMMHLHRKHSSGSFGPRLFLAFVLSLTVLTPARADRAPAALDKPVPENVQDLRAIQERVKKVLKTAIPCTVGIRLGNTGGSGVIVSKDGYVLTAGHISGESPGRKVKLVLHDGRVINGKTLGSNKDMDSGMIQITDKGEWPFAEMGDASKVEKGQWCLTLGHPDGYKPGRPPVVRLGRVLRRTNKLIHTSCPLVGGDSGGPLFDMDGKVIGIHSRIGERITANIHVPVDTYRATWDRLVSSEVWGGREDRERVGNPKSVPYLGVFSNPEAEECRIAKVEKDSPADKAGIRADDVVIRFGEEKIGDFDKLSELIRKHKPGDKVPLHVRRGKEIVKLTVVLGRKRDA